MHKVHLLYGGGGEGGILLWKQEKNPCSTIMQEKNVYTVQDLHLGKVEHILMDYKASKDMMAYSAPLMKI